MIDKSSFSGGPAIHYWAFGKQFESLFARADNEQAVKNFNSRTEDLLTDLFTDKEPARNHYCSWQRNLGEEWSKTTTKHEEVGLKNETPHQ